MKRQNLRTVALIVVTLTYLLIGAAIFGYLESDYEVRQREHLELMEGMIRRRYNISEDDYNVLTTVVIKSAPHKAGTQWQFRGALYFATTVVTTIGYGHSTPATLAGRSFCMVYALIGIPLGLVMFQSIGERLNTFVGASLKYVKRCLFKAREPEVTQTNLVMVVLVLSTILMTSMAAVFAKYERWDYLDALYYCFITLTTIGFGDYVALQKDSALQNKLEYFLLSLIFILFGLSVVSSAVNLLVLKFLTLNTEDERRDEQLRFTANLNPIQLEGDIISAPSPPKPLDSSLLGREQPERLMIAGAPPSRLPAAAAAVRRGPALANPLSRLHCRQGGLAAGEPCAPFCSSSSLSLSLSVAGHPAAKKCYQQYYYPQQLQLQLQPPAAAHEHQNSEEPAVFGVSADSSAREDRLLDEESRTVSRGASASSASSGVANTANKLHLQTSSRCNLIFACPCQTLQTESNCFSSSSSHLPHPGSQYNPQQQQQPPPSRPAHPANPLHHYPPQHSHHHLHHLHPHPHPHSHPHPHHPHHPRPPRHPHPAGASPKLPASSDLHRWPLQHQHPLSGCPLGFFRCACATRPGRHPHRGQRQCHRGPSSKGLLDARSSRRSHAHCHRRGRAGRRSLTGAQSLTSGLTSRSHSSHELLFRASLNPSTSELSPAAAAAPPAPPPPLHSPQRRADHHKDPASESRSSSDSHLSMMSSSSSSNCLAAGPSWLQYSPETWGENTLFQAQESRCWLPAATADHHLNETRASCSPWACQLVATNSDEQRTRQARRPPRATSKFVNDNKRMLASVSANSLRMHTGNENDAITVLETSRRGKKQLASAGKPFCHCCCQHLECLERAALKMIRLRSQQCLAPTRLPIEVENLSMSGSKQQPHPTTSDQNTTLLSAAPGNFDPIKKLEEKSKSEQPTEISILSVSSLNSSRPAELKQQQLQKTVRKRRRKQQGNQEENPEEETTGEAPEVISD